MDELIIETGHQPEISVTSQGKLYIKGWDRAEVRASASGKNNLSLNKDGENVTVRSLSHCEMRVPYESSLVVHSAHGEVILKSVTGEIIIQQAAGGVTLNDVGTVRIEDVSRDLNAHEVNGHLTVGQANRFVNVNFIHGDFTAESIASHLTLSKVEGNISAHVLGNATLNLEPNPNQTCTVEAHGVLTCQIPPNANVTLELIGHGPLVTKIGNKTKTLKGNTSITLGDGSSKVSLTGFGPVTVFESDSDQEETSHKIHFSFDDTDLEMDTLSQNISRQVTEQIEIQMDILNAQMDALIESGNFSQEKAARIRAKTEEKMARAHEKIERAQERAAEKIEKARRRAEKERGSNRGIAFEGIEAAREGVRTGISAAREAITAVFGNASAKPKSVEPVSDEERMMILNMLAEKKISIEEAETLLSALEGRNQ